MRIEIVEINNHGVWDVWHNGELIIENTRTPLCSAARLLLTRGADENAILEKVRCGSDRVDMRARIGDAAKLTVDSERFKSYRPPATDAPQVCGLARPAIFPGQGQPR